MNSRTLQTSALCAILTSILLECAPGIAADMPSYEDSAAYIQEKGTVESSTPNKYYDPTKESEYYATIRRDVYQLIQFPEECVMEIVYAYYEEVAPPTTSGLNNNYGLTEREVITVMLNEVVPSQIYKSKRPDDGTAVIIKARKGGISSKTELFFDQAGNKNIFGLTMRDALMNSKDSPFGKLECAVETCTRSRAFNGYGITPGKNEFTDGLQDALSNIAKTCGGTG